MWLLLMISIDLLSCIFLEKKNDAFDAFVSYNSKVENQLSRKIKRIRSDRGGEYVSLNAFCERKNRTWKEMMNSMLISTSAPDNSWGESILSACHLQNKIPHKRTGKTPYKMWKVYKPN